MLFEWAIGALVSPDVLDEACVTTNGVFQHKTINW